MVSIIAQNMSLVFPLVGSDSKFGNRTVKSGLKDTAVGGQILQKDGVVTGIRAIDTVSITLKPGDRLGIVGHNGSGKSTLLRMLAGIYPPSSGKIKIDGRVNGMFSLNLGINKEASGLENIRIKGLMYGLRPKEIEAAVQEITEFSELGSYISMPVKTYSTGMVMRLMFATASVFSPDILLLDEWVSTGDKSFRNKVNEKLTDMFDKIPIVVIASHNEKRIRSWATHAIRLEKGRSVPL